MGPLYKVVYSDADGLHEGVKYHFWRDVITDVRMRVNTGWSACVYRFHHKYKMYLYWTDLEAWNEVEKRRQLALLKKETADERNL